MLAEGSLKICFMCRFQGQTKLHGSKPSDFRKAIEEAVIVESGYGGSGMEAAQETSPSVNHCETEEATGSNQESGCTIQQVSNCAYQVLLG